MKASLQWMNEYVPVDMNRPAQELADELTQAGIPVEDVIAMDNGIKKIYTGKIVEITKHPDADKLQVCQVECLTEEGEPVTKQIVTAATNVAVGQIVPVAYHKSRLADGTEIKKGKLRGVVSEGMFCSVAEFGISSDLVLPEEAQGIYIFPEGTPIGLDVKDVLGLNDTVYEFELTANRADCFSMVGLSREFGIMTNQKALFPVIMVNENGESIEGKASVSIEADDLCTRFMSRIVTDVKVEPSPLWMQNRLRNSGIRPINNVVDVTNYVMLELGQPMHAFDASKVSQPVQVRLANNGEELVLLDGTTAKLQPNTLVIADQTGPLAMAGIFGGQASGVDAETTKDVILEAAFFAPLSIAGRARQYGLHTDSSHRFERGVDFTLQRHAMERATALLLEICGGEAGEICEVVSEQYLPKVNEVTLRREKLDSLLGHHIETETVTEIFERLGFAVKYANDVWTVTSASWRFDIEIEEDLIEEVARIYGYNSIPNNAPLAHLRMREHKEADLELSRIKTALVDADYQEAITYSFVDPKVQTLLHPEIDALVLPNPISVEMSAMRVSLLSGLLGAVLYNQNRQQNRVRLFETGLRFVPDANAEFGVRQEFVLAGVITGTAKSECWTGKAETVDFFDLKGDLESILSLTEVGNRVRFMAKAYSALHPGQSAAIELDGKEIGFIGTIHPLIAQKLGLNGKAVVFEILWDAIANRRVVQAKEISKFPANRRDLALVVSDNVPAGDIIDACKQAGGEKLTQVNLFDVYQGIGVASGHKSLAISLTIQDNEKTLEDDEINAVISAVLNEVKQRFNAELRD